MLPGIQLLRQSSPLYIDCGYSSVALWKPWVACALSKHGQTGAIIHSCGQELGLAFLALSPCRLLFGVRVACGTGTLSCIGRQRRVWGRTGSTARCGGGYGARRTALQVTRPASRPRGRAELAPPYVRVPDPVEGPAPLGVAPRHTRASLHGRNDHRVVRSPVVVLGPPGVGFASGRGPRSRACSRARPLPGDVRRGAHAWIGEAGDVSSLN